MTDDLSTRTCQGCHKVHDAPPTQNYHGGTLAQVKLTNGTVFAVCGTPATCNLKTERPSAKAECLKRAVFNLHQCAACPEPVLFPGLLCRECRDLFAREKARQVAESGATVEDAPRTYYLNEGRLVVLLGHVESLTGPAVRSMLVGLGATIVGQYLPHAPGANDTPDNDRVFPHATANDYYDKRDWWELRATPARWAAMRESFTRLAELLATAKQKSHAQGQSLLLNLATGKITMDEFNDRGAKNGRDL